MADNSYRKIIKSTSLFGVVQLSNLFISAVRHKFFAVIIGPAGYGVLSFLYSSFDLVKQATGFGIDVSGVKKISEAPDREHKEKMASLLIKLSLITGIFGTIVFAALSYYLSVWSFGNGSKTIFIAIIAVALLFRQIVAAQNAVMQGEGKLLFLAKTNVLGNLFGLAASLPLFMIWKVNAILPTIFVSALISLGISYFYYSKLQFKKVNFSVKQTIAQGKDVLFFGGLLAINSFLPLLSNYIIQLFINYQSDIANVGFFNTGQVIINSYVGIVFNAMAMEYYPRLAGYNKDVEKEGDAVSQQAIISMLVMLPIIIFFLEFLPYVIRILLSQKFMAVVPMLSWSILAMFFRAVSWSMGYVIIARADSKVFMKTSVIFNLLYILFCAGGYYLRGLEGLGFGFMCYYIVHMVSVYVVVKLRYKLLFDKEMYRLLAFGILLCILLGFVNLFASGYLKHTLLILLMIVCNIFSVYEINKRVHLKYFFINFINKRRSNGHKE